MCKRSRKCSKLSTPWHMWWEILWIFILYDVIFLYFFLIWKIFQTWSGCPRLLHFLLSTSARPLFLVITHTSNFFSEKFLGKKARNLAFTWRLYLSSILYFHEMLKISLALSFFEEVETTIFFSIEKIASVLQLSL